MTADPALLVVTGANGELGRRLIQRVSVRHPVRALVRSNSAAKAVEALPLPEGRRADVRIVDTGDAEEMAKELQGADAIVHLVGILKESSRSRYRDAHETACDALASAAESIGARRIVYLSILGAHPDSANACLASKGRAERILLEAPVPATVLRVPMVLGGNDPASHALRGQARARWLPLVRGGASLEQPIDADDVVSAILAAIERAELAEPPNGELDLGGPESLSHRALVARAAGICGRPAPKVLPVPLFAIRAVASLVERWVANPPITKAMLGVLEHDDRVDASAACERLGLELTSLDETLRRCVAEEDPPG